MALVQTVIVDSPHASRFLIDVNGDVDKDFKNSYEHD